MGQKLSQKLSLTLHSGGGLPLPANWRKLLNLLPPDLRDAYEERAAMIEFDGGEKRATAERRAFECEIWRNESMANFCAQLAPGAGAIAGAVT